MDLDNVGKVRTEKEFVEHSADLLDTEAQRAFEVIVAVHRRYIGRPNTVENLEAERDEVLTKLMEIGILATYDPTPCLNGEPPMVEILGKVKMHPDGVDHEAKGWEIRKAKGRGEDYLGQKEAPNSIPAQKRAKSGRPKD